MRIRSVKPEFFHHEELFDLERETKLPIRLTFVGLWCAADREGRFKWRPRALKVDILPYDEVNFDAILDALEQKGFIQKYEYESEFFGFIPSFTTHQTINQREAESSLPEPRTCMHVHAREKHVHAREKHVHAREKHVHARGEGKGKEGKGREGDITCAETAQAPSSAPPIFLFPCDGPKSQWGLDQTQIDGWMKLYPHLDVLAECRRALAWIEANPSRRKTSSGMARFLVNWFNRSQNNRGGVAPQAPVQRSIAGEGPKPNF
jgi:hypothetical protein